MTAIKGKYNGGQEEKASQQCKYEHWLFSTTDVSSYMFVWIQNISCKALYSKHYARNMIWI